MGSETSLVIHHLSHSPLRKAARSVSSCAVSRSEIEKSRDLTAANRTVETISDPDIRRAAEVALYNHALRQGIQNLR